MNDDWGVNEILDEATHPSVTRRRLTNTKRGRFGLFQKAGLLRGWLYDKPLVEYISNGEVVEYCSVESDDSTGITISGDAITSLLIVEELDRSTLRSQSFHSLSRFHL